VHRICKSSFPDGYVYSPVQHGRWPVLGPLMVFEPGIIEMPLQRVIPSDSVRVWITS